MGHYARLSYCWGGDQIVKTTRKTLEQMIRGIEVSTLPQSLQDAVTVARQMGVRWLWVDCLCIIQGDSLDWAIESARMSDVYRNALFMISADVALNARAGSSTLR